MNIRNFSAQTQRSLRQMDINQDQHLNVRELQALKNKDIVPGIAPADLILIQQELQQATSAEQTIVSFVDYTLPGVKIPEAANPFLNQGVTAGKKAALAEPAPVQFSFTPSTEQKDSINPEPIEAGELKAVSDLGPLQVTGSSRFQDNSYQGSKLNATLKANPKLELSANLDAPTTPEGQNAPVKMDLGAQTQLGKLKVSTRSNFDDSGFSKSALNTDLEVFTGHHLRTETTLTDQGLGIAKVNSSHQVFKSVSLDGGLEINPDSGQMPSQSIGLTYAAEPNSALAGIKIRTEARRNESGFDAAKISTSKALKAGVSIKGSLEFDALGNQKQGVGFSYSAAQNSVFSGLNISAEAESKTDSATGRQQPDLNLKMGYSIKF